MINVGITGTRNGMTKAQRETFFQTLEHIVFKYPTIKRFHHGQCIGVDVESAIMAEDDFDLFIISHPPIKEDLIGECFNHEIRPAKSYFARNRDIVDESDLMFVVPLTKEHQNKGGTWYTHDYALKHEKPTIVINPQGQLTLYNIEL